MMHVTACLALFFSVLAGGFYLLLRGMRANAQLNLDEFSELKREWDTMPFVSVSVIPATM